MIKKARQVRAKAGSKVALLHDNNDLELAAGTIGEVVRLDDTGRAMLVEFRDGMGRGDLRAYDWLNPSELLVLHYFGQLD